MFLRCGSFDLTITTLRANSAWQTDLFLSFSAENRLWDFIQIACLVAWNLKAYFLGKIRKHFKISSADMQKIYMKCRTPFSGKNKKIITKCRLLICKNAWNVNHCFLGKKEKYFKITSTENFTQQLSVKQFVLTCLLIHEIFPQMIDELSHSHSRPWYWIPYN